MVKKKNRKNKKIIKIASFIPLVISILMSIYYYSFYSRDKIQFSPTSQEAIGAVKSGISLFLIAIIASFILSIVVILTFFYMFSNKSESYS